MRSPKPDPFRVVAIVSAYNEADVISPVIKHLVEQGIDVYLIDNRSTDATVMEARPWLGKGLLEIEEFPREPPPGDGPFPFDWGAILRRKEVIAGQIAADWIIHHDADEFRESPWPGMSLKEGIRWVDRLGYNCIDFRVLNFPPVDDGFRPGDDPREYFTRWKEPIAHDTVQLKCWKVGAAPVSLAATGGHEVRFPGRRAFPVKFLLRHYPIRGQANGRRKVFAERKNRFLESERAKGWHVQYDELADENESFLSDPSQLVPFDPDHVRLELMLRNEIFRAADANRERTEGENAVLRARIAELEEARTELASRARSLEADREKLAEHVVAIEALRAERERLIGQLESGRAELERHAENLAEDRERLREYVMALDAERTKQSDRARELETLREEQDRRIAQLDDARRALAEEVDSLAADASCLRETLNEGRRHAANLESAQTEMQAYLAALESIRADRERHVANLEAARAERERYVRSLEESRTELERRIAQASSLRKS